MKKFGVLLICCLIVLSMMLAACGGNGEEADTAEGGGACEGMYFRLVTHGGDELLTQNISAPSPISLKPDGFGAACAVVNSHE